ncbi:PR domain zinc finger protein 8 [Orchesella cincta]|uniref:PR domain zinc finger protein 8 n=1 Tax=Orchesella cincta TaxID=48709 RepID=A0A1D2MYH1_ORCCI|nr:PR domain zinc finger protein 8 [Orchesella cincta]
MTSSVTIPTTGSRNPGSTAAINTSPGSATPDQVVRKKRTFDIAFLTGQSEKESSTSNVAGDFSDRESPPTNNNNIERKCAAFLSSDRSHSPYNLTQDGTNSDSSSIDVMTNGSLSESESQSHSPSSSIPEQPSPPLHPVVLIHHQHHQQQLQQLKSITPLSSNGGISHRNSNNSGHGHHHHHHHHHHHVDIKSGPPVAGSGSSGHKSRNNRSPVKEEIRFESRRTIDINHTVDSLKIKENLQFSTLLPSSAAVSFNLSGNNGGGAGNGPVSGSSGSSGSSSRTISVTSGTDLSLPHLASTIALLPHVARFPLGLPSLAASGSVGGIHGNHMGPGSMPFHAKLEKSESINISYPKVRGAFPDPYAALAASAAGGYPYPNLLLSQEFNRHPSFPSPLGSPGSASGAGSASGGGQQVSQQAPPPQQGPPCGMGPSTTLLPPSLTSLTLPAQNVCAKCNIGFRMTSDLVYHMRSHHKRDTDPMKKQREEKLKCPVCHETFRERHHLTRHMTAHQDRAEEI